MSRYEQMSKKFDEHVAHSQDNSFKTAGESMTVEEKLKILEDRGQENLIEIFKGWKPRAAPRRRKGAPLDQRISLSLTSQDRAVLNGELKAIKATGQATSLGNIIRTRAMGNLDVQGWKQVASDALDELTRIVDNQGQLQKEKKQLEAALENAEDEEETSVLEKKLYALEQDLGKLKPQSSEKRSVRLQGRMTFAEAETVKWRASRLYLSTTDYLRIMLFNLEPNGTADSHLSVDARRRFYVGILEVAENGFGDPPGVYKCSQCESYAEEITRLKAQIANLRSQIER